MTARILRFILAALALLLITMILWIDLATNLWQDYVVISGLAAGLITFVFTILVVDRIVARSTHERWAPVTRLALGDLRRSLTDETTRTTVRRLPDPEDESGFPGLIVAADHERDRLTAELARWSSFLASSADVTEVMDAVADIAENLNEIDEGARAALAGPQRQGSSVEEVRSAIAEYHRAGDQLLEHIDAVLEVHRKRSVTA